MEAERTFRLGHIEIAPIWDGTLDTKLSYITNMDTGMAACLVEAEAQSTGCDPLVLPVYCFLISLPGRRLLIDTGGGSSKPGRLGFMVDSLALRGLVPGDIDTIVFTHLHRDHYCGLLDPEGKPRFERASIFVHHAEATAWLETPFERQHPRSQRHSKEVATFLALYRDRLFRVPDGEIAAGVSIEIAPGHTPGHSCIRIRSAGQTAVAIGDVIHLAAVQIPRPDTAMHYDCDPDTAYVTRKKVLSSCAQDRSLVLGAHLPGGVGTIEPDNGGFRYTPAR